MDLQVRRKNLLDADTNAREKLKKARAVVNDVIVAAPDDELPWLVLLIPPILDKLSEFLSSSSPPPPPPTPCSSSSLSSPPILIVGRNLRANIAVISSS